MKTLTKTDTNPEVQALLRDLNKPSLHGLSYALRHPETWPEGFVWNYSFCEDCAIGLAHELWRTPLPTGHQEIASAMARSFAMSYEAAERIFFHANLDPSVPKNFFGLCSARRSSITPDQVADQIDAYLASAE